MFHINGATYFYHNSLFSYWCNAKITLQRCLTWRNKDNHADDNSIMKENEEKHSYSMSRLLCCNSCNIFKFCVKANNQRDKQCENKCPRLKTLLQEKEKLLTPCENKVVTSNDNMDLKQRLISKMSFSSFSSANIKNKGRQTSDKRNIKESRNNEFPALSIQDTSRKDEKSICFSDTDLKFLVIPVSSNKCNAEKHDGKIMLCEWNSGNINEYFNEQKTNSKLIELKLESTDSFSDTQRYENPSKSNDSPCSFISKTLASESKYFSDSATTRLDILPNVYLKKLARSTSSYTGSTISNASSTNKIKIDYPEYAAPRARNDLDILCAKVKHNSTPLTSGSLVTATDKLNETTPNVKLNECGTKLRKVTKKVQSSVDTRLNYYKHDTQSLQDQIKEMRSSYRKSRSDETVASKIRSPRGRNNNMPNYFIAQDITLIPEKLVCNNGRVHAPLNHDSETSETYDELGILFSQCMKLQAQPCHRKCCPLSRHLRQRAQHSVRKCQMRLNYLQIYPYDQRPACNSGNVCTDTYDELKLMCTSPRERRNIYKRMFRRRKQFLNQPYTLSNQNFLAAR